MPINKPLPPYVGEHKIDKITLDVIENALQNARWEMDRFLLTAAAGSQIRVQKDEFPMITDREGRMVIGQFGSAINEIFKNSPYEKSDIHDGDVIVVNDPYLCEGSISHLPDMIVVRPIFHSGDLVGYSSQWGHLMDVGGVSAGSIPIDATSMYEEGIMVPPIKLYDRGKLNKEALYIISRNSRIPKIIEADIKAICAGTLVGAERVQQLCDRYGKETYLEACNAILDRTRAGMVKIIREHIPEGQTWTFEDYADDDGLGNGPIKLKLTMHREGDYLILDWTGSESQVPGPINFFLNPEMFKMFAGVFLIISFAPDLPFNDGYYDVLEAILPEGSIVRPREPAPLSNRLTVMARQFDVLQGLFAKAIKGFAVADSYGTSPNFIYSGNKSDKQAFLLSEVLFGGIPARPVGDGLDGHTWWPEFRTLPAEYLEKIYPIRVIEHSAKADTGGAGKFRGGHGIRRIYEFLEPGVISFQDDRAYTFPLGVLGGRAGGGSAKFLVRANTSDNIELPSKVKDVPVYKGDRLIFETAGGGGMGDPLERDPALVSLEVKRGLISASAARDQYGVSLNKSNDPDQTATEALRSKLRASRKSLSDFDYGPIPPAEELRKKIANDRLSFNRWLAEEKRKQLMKS